MKLSKVILVFVVAIFSVLTFVLVCLFVYSTKKIDLSNVDFEKNQYISVSDGNAHKIEAKGKVPKGVN
ncbi:MAG: hypothetical protein ACRC5M_06385, partial [Anaeroplasmataceae bacterium]